MEEFENVEGSINHQALARKGYAEVQYGEGSRNVVEFYQDKIFLAFQSEQQGRKVYEAGDFLRIYIPGNKLSVVSRKATDQDKLQYSKEWAAYQAQHEQIPEGIPLESCMMLNVADVANLKALRIHTVEQLVGMPDGNVSNLGPGYVSIRAKVKQWYDGSRKSEEMNKLMARIESLERDNLALKNTLNGIPPDQRKVEVQAQQPIKRKPGRPRKQPLEDSHGTST